jgi:hypothetical protein
MKGSTSKRGILWLVIGIPAAAVVMGFVSLWIALSDPDPGVEFDGRPLSKTSYRDEE